jgi:hypothetical protein
VASVATAAREDLGLRERLRRFRPSQRLERIRIFETNREGFGLHGDSRRFRSWRESSEGFGPSGDRHLCSVLSIRQASAGQVARGAARSASSWFRPRRGEPSHSDQRGFGRSGTDGTSGFDRAFCSAGTDGPGREGRFGGRLEADGSAVRQRLRVRSGGAGVTRW